MASHSSASEREVTNVWFAYDSVKRLTRSDRCFRPSESGAMTAAHRSDTSRRCSSRSERMYAPSTPPTTWPNSASPISRDTPASAHHDRKDDRNPCTVPGTTPSSRSSLDRVPLLRVRPTGLGEHEPDATGALAGPRCNTSSARLDRGTRRPVACLVPLGRDAPDRRLQVHLGPRGASGLTGANAGQGDQFKRRPPWPTKRRSLAPLAMASPATSSAGRALVMLHAVAILRQGQHVTAPVGSSGRRFCRDGPGHDRPNAP